MILFDHSTYDASNIEGNLGVSEYSYWFVRKAFRPVLERFGTVIPVRDPKKEVDAIHLSAKRHGMPSLFFSFNPPHHTPVGLACPTIPVFAWEYDTIPADSWHGDESNNWASVLRRVPGAITHSSASVESVLKSAGNDYPIRSIPAPVFDAKVKYAPSARGWHERRELSLSTGVVFDTWALDLGVFSPERVGTHGAHVLNLVDRATRGKARPATNLVLRGVVYSSVFNPADGRKNWEDLVSGFIWAFRAERDATLVLKLAHWNLDEGARPILAHIAKLGAFQCRVIVIHGVLSEADYEQVLEATSYTVNTSCGEGQCLPLMEFMAAGRPAIAPRHTAMINYVDASNSFVVASHERPAFWPHDMRHAITCRRHQPNFADLVRCYHASFRVARHEPAVYTEMSRAASEAQRRFCSTDVVVERLREVIDGVSKRVGQATSVALAAPEQSPPENGMKLISDFEKKAAGEGVIDSFQLGFQDAVWSGWFNNDAGELMTGFPIGPEDVVVDVGCGDGGYANFSGRRGAHVILVDVDGSKIHGARERVEASGARQVDIHVSDCNPMPLAEGSVTRVVCTEVIEHVDDPAQFVAELARVGKPGALYLLTVPGAEQETLQKELAPPNYFEKPNHVRILEPQEFAALVEGAGLEIVHRTSYGFYWSVWWLIFWQTEVRFGESNHPSLEAWARCWHEVLQGKDGRRIKKAFDAFMPKSQVIIAQKPG